MSLDFHKLRLLEVLGCDEKGKIFKLGLKKSQSQNSIPYEFLFVLSFSGVCCFVCKADQICAFSLRGWGRFTHNTPSRWVLFLHFLLLHVIFQVLTFDFCFYLFACVPLTTFVTSNYAYIQARWNQFYTFTCSLWWSWLVGTTYFCSKNLLLLKLDAFRMELYRVKYVSDTHT